MIILLDNAKIHVQARVKELCQRAGVLLEYLPPYSPDFNPIKQSFKSLKDWLRRHYKEVDAFDDFVSFLFYAIEECCSARDSRGYFKNCGYIIDM